MLKDLEVVSMLGPCFGSNGVVLLAIQGAKLLAVKKIDLEDISRKDLGAVQKELFLVRQLKHANLMPVESSFVDSSCLYVVSPAAGYGSCADLIANHFSMGLSEPAIGIILRDVLQALSYLHAKRIVHRAVRGRHILVTSNGRAVLTCLRYSETVAVNSPSHAFAESDADNLNWLAPEVLAQDADGYDKKSDIYSIGMTCLELVNGAAPFSDASATFMLVQKLIDDWVPSFSREVSSHLLQVRDACTLKDPHLRPTAQQLATLSFFKVKGDLRQFLHPVIPMASHQMEANSDDLRAIMENSQKIAGTSVDCPYWNFD